jgi:transcriptional repressor NrdR
MEELAHQVEELLRVGPPDPTSQRVGLAVLEQLKGLDEIAYVRFASVYKGFEELGDFQREVGLLTKTTEPKRRV